MLSSIRSAPKSSGDSAARSRRMRVRRALGTIGLAATVAPLLACPDDELSGCPPGDEVRITPFALTAAPGASLAVRTYVKDEVGYFRDAVPADLVWTSSDPAVVSVTVSGTVVAVAAGAAVVRASLASDPSRCDATLVGVTASVTSGEDVVTTAHEKGALVDALIARAWSGSECIDHVLPLALIGPVGKLTSAVGEIVCADEALLFASDREVLSQAVPWSDGTDVVPVGPQNPFLGDAPARPPRTLQLALHNWVARHPAYDDAVLDGLALIVAQEIARVYLLDNLDFAGALFRLNRVGVRLEFNPSAIEVAPYPDLAGCPTTGPAPAWVPLPDGRLHVVIVDFLRDGGGGIARGLACAAPFAHVVMLQNQFARTDILAHELGHALGLRGGQGHTQAIGLFESHNVMWSEDEPTRLHFSLGQAYRMNLDPASWLLTPLPTPPPSTCEPASSTCPTLALDVRHRP